MTGVLSAGVGQAAALLLPSGPVWSYFLVNESRTTRPRGPEKQPGEGRHRGAWSARRPGSVLWGCMWEALSDLGKVSLGGHLARWAVRVRSVECRGGSSRTSVAPSSWFQGHGQVWGGLFALVHAPTRGTTHSPRYLQLVVCAGGRGWGEVPVLGSDSAPPSCHSLAWTLAQPEELSGTEMLVPCPLWALCHRLGLHGPVLPGAPQLGRGEGSFPGRPLPTVGAPAGRCARAPAGRFFPPVPVCFAVTSPLNFLKGGFGVWLHSLLCLSIYWQPFSASWRLPASWHSACMTAGRGALSLSRWDVQYPGGRGAAFCLDTPESGFPSQVCT